MNNIKAILLPLGGMMIVWGLSGWRPNLATDLPYSNLIFGFREIDFYRIVAGAALLPLGWYLRSRDLANKLVSDERDSLPPNG